MKLLIIVNVDWFLYSHRLPIIIEARRKGFEVHIATKITNSSIKEKLINHGFLIHEIPFDRTGKNIFNLIKVTFLISRLIAIIKPDILHLVTMQPIIFGGISAKLFRTNAVVYSISGLGHVFLQKTFFDSLRKFFVINFYKLALSNKTRVVVFQNSSDKLFLKKLCNLLDSEMILIPGSGVDINKYKYTKLPKTDPVILMASRLLITKGVREFVQAAQILKKKGIKVNFQLVGEPDISNPTAITKRELDDWVSNGYIDYLGYRNDIHKIIPKSHIVVLPSYYPEGLPKILCEAAACGRPIITTNEPGCKDAVKDGKTGLLIKSRDSKDLAEAIEKLIKNREMLNNMCLEGRKNAEKFFDVKKVVDKHLSTYKYLIELKNKL